MEKILLIISTLIELAMVNREVIVIYCRYSPMDHTVQIYAYDIKSSHMLYTNIVNLGSESALENLLTAEDKLTDLVLLALESQRLKEDAA